MPQVLGSSGAANDDQGQAGDFNEPGAKLDSSV
jgi:hypothetical protein